jgi:RHS repeat-associated protein
MPGMPGESVFQTLAYHPTTGNVESVGREFGQFSYSHDALDQLTGSSYAGSLNLPIGLTQQTLTFDRVGNRTTESRVIANVLTENATHFLLPDPHGLGSLTTKVDKQTGAAEGFAYRADQRLTSYSKDGLSVEYRYDALGRRVSKTVNGGPTLPGGFTQAFSHLVGEDRVALTRAGDGVLRLQLDGQEMNEHLGQLSASGTASSYVVDHLGSVLSSQASGAKTGFSAWGQFLGSTPTFSSTTDPAQPGFTGHETDLESGLVYARARMLDPGDGRFISSDPIWPDDGVNGWPYVGNDPLSWLDLDGESRSSPDNRRQDLPEGGGPKGGAAGTGILGNIATWVKTRITKTGGAPGVTIRYPSGRIKDITGIRVKEQIPAPQNPGKGIRDVIFPGGSNKRGPTKAELDLLEKLTKDKCP